MSFPGNTDDATSQVVRDEGMSDVNYEQEASGAHTGAEKDTGEKTAVIMMSVLIVLAVAASIVMLFASSTGWMKIAVLAALWAAVIGALLVTRYRRQLDSQQARLADMERLHQIELDRELATHREQELILEQNYLDSLEGDKEDTISQLRAEIIALREQLSELLGEGFDDERVALIARAERLRELDSPQPASPLKDPLANNRPEPRAKTYREEATANGTVGAHTAHGTAESAARGVSEPVDVPEVSKAEEEATAESSARTAGGGFNTGTFRAVDWQVSGHSASDTEQTTQMDTVAIADEDSAAQGAEQTPAAEPAPAQATEATEPEATNRHGRRRREDNADGLTVAELLKQIRN